MPIVYLAVISAALVAVLWAYPRIRLVGGILAALVIGGITAYMVLVRPSVEMQQRRISIDELRLQGLSLDDNGRSLVLSGRVENLSESYVLRDMTLRVRLYDCARAESDLSSCETIGDDEGVARVQVPPGQVREFSAIFYYPGLPELRGTMRWKEEILLARATERRS